MKTIAVELKDSQIANLDAIVRHRGTSQSEVVAVLIEREWRESGLGAPAECPWKITAKAVDDLLEIMGRGPEAEADAREILRAACVDAYLAEREGQRRPREGAGGTLRYRGPRPRKLTLVVWRGTLIGVAAGGRRDR